MGVEVSTTTSFLGGVAWLAVVSFQAIEGSIAASAVTAAAGVAG